MEQNFDYSRHYKKWHDNTIEHAELMRNYYYYLIGDYFNKIGKNANILDLGCGSGFAVYALTRKGYNNVTGIDISKEQIKNCPIENLNIKHVKDTLQYLNDHEGFYEVVLAFDFLEHIPLSQQIIYSRSIQKALKENGFLICTVPNSNSVLAASWRYIDWTHTCSFTEHSLDFVLFNGGFSIIEIKPIEFFLRPQYTWVNRATVKHWILFKLVRYFRRLQFVAELGSEQGKKVPLSLNILGFAQK